MTKKDRYLVALDVGSTKTCALIADIEDGGAKFLAMGAAESKGSRKGLIVNLDAAVSSIRRALEEAEGVAGVPVESAVVGVAGSHVRGVNSRGGISLGTAPRDIEREDVRRAVDAARAITPAGRSRSAARAPAGISASISQDNIRDPIGMVGQNLEVNVHIVTASASATQNVVTAVNRAGVVVSDTALEPLASAEAVLTQDERELGCCLLDIGGGTTGTDRLFRRRGAPRRGAARRRRPFHQRSGRRPAHADSRSRKNQARARLRLARTDRRGSRHRNRQRRRSPAAHRFRAHAQ